jgi:hypothetical protein
MGVEYIHYLLPKSRAFAPSRVQLTQLLDGLRADRWVAGEPRAEHAGADTMLVFGVEQFGASGLRAPFVLDGGLAADAYYEVQLHIAAEYVYRTSELIDPFEDTSCACGEDLELQPTEDLFYTSRLRVACTACGQPFDPTSKMAMVRDPWTDEESPIAGGATYRFALAIDCGKYVPHEEGQFELDPALPALLAARLGTPFVDVRDID